MMLSFQKEQRLDQCEELSTKTERPLTEPTHISNTAVRFLHGFAAMFPSSHVAMNLKVNYRS